MYYILYFQYYEHPDYVIKSTFLKICFWLLRDTQLTKERRL